MPKPPKSLVTGQIISMVLMFAAACSSGEPRPPGVEDFLPALPPTGGSAGAEAGLVTEQNRATRVPGGGASKGLPGDYYLGNDKVRLLIQAPGRVGEPLGWGGNPINLAWVKPDGTARTQFGEIGPFLNVSHTARFTRVEVVRDGSAGGPAVIRAFGEATVLDYMNIAGFVDGLEILAFDAYVPPNLDVAATYILEPGAGHVRVIYTLFNRGSEAIPVAIGSFADSRGTTEYFTPNEGFGSAGVDQLSSILGSGTSVDYWAAQTPDGAYAMVPAAQGVNTERPNVAIFIAGIAASIFDSANIIKGISESNLTVPATGGRSYEMYLVAGRDIGAVHGQVLRLRAKTIGELRGLVTRADDGRPLAGTRVAVLDAQDRPVTVYTTDADGSFGGHLLPGTYRLVADRSGWPRSAPVPVTVSAGASATPPTIALAVPARVEYTVVDGAGQPLAARLTFVGAPPSGPDRRFRDPAELSRKGIAAVRLSRHGTSTEDGAVEVEPGEYRVVAFHGSEFSNFDRRITFTAGANDRLQITLHRVVDTTGYLACDFHQHAVRSPDSTVPLEQRVLSYLSAGIEFIASSDHDYHTDYGPAIAAVGAQDLLGSMVGVESTPFDYGHFNAFPLQVDPLSPSGGTIDWGAGALDNMSPGRIFAALRGIGAQVVQVNHPRATDARSTPVSGFQAFFDRAALTFDLTTGSFFGDSTTQPVANELLRIAVGEPMWSADFDTLEVYNGFSPSDYDNDGVVEDEKVEVVMRDWFNFLSVGKLITAVGNTDSHTLYKTVVDAPRTYVRVPDDTRPGAVPAQDVLDGLKVRRDAIVTNGPFITLHVNGSVLPSIGAVVTDTDGSVDLLVRVQAPTWMDMDRVEIYANQTFRIPPPATGHDPLEPRLIVRLSENPQAGETLLVRKTVGGAERWEAEVRITGFVLPDPGRDAWIVAQVRGSRSLYPFIPDAVSGSTSHEQLMAGTLTSGARPLAFTNAAFIDRDGNGRYDAPYAPR